MELNELVKVLQSEIKVSTVDLASFPGPIPSNCSMSLLHVFSTGTQ